MNPLRTAMPAIVAHEGEWEGTYRHIDADGTLLDEHRTLTSCLFPEEGDHHYIQHSRLIWANGRQEEYRFGGRLRDGLLRWETERFHGHGWETHDGVLMLRLERHDVPGAYYIEMINLAPDGRTRARTWQWFRDGKPWKRTLCDEWRIG
jgi:hypothetical protein